MNLFFNTISLEGSELKEANRQCEKQEERVLKIFERFERLTPIQAHKLYEKEYSETPLTSIRRCLTNLTSQGKLAKINVFKREKYNKNNHYWSKCLDKD